MDNSKLMSIILLSYYSGERIVSCYNIVKERFEQENIPFEFIVMDDGSKDDSYQIALKLEKQYNNVKAYQLSRNYTPHYSKFAGFSVCHGACATSMPDDMQQPLDTYVQMYRYWEQGHKLVIPNRESRNDGRISDWFSKSYYKIMNALSIVQFPIGGCDVFLADREIIDILNERIHPINTSTTVEVLRLGYDPFFFSFERPKVSNKSRWTFRKKLKLATDTFLSSSSFPIKFITQLGLLTSLLSLLMIIATVIIRLNNLVIMGFSIPGWASIVIFISFFSGLILLSLGIIAEYIWRIYEEVKNRPGYIIKKK